MLKSQKTLLKSAIAVAAIAALAACGGGGGGGGAAPGPGGGGGSVIPTPTPTPTPTAPPANATGQMMINGSAMTSAQVIFTCGCSTDAGAVTADANGNYSITSAAVPGFPTAANAYQAVAGRNYMVVGASTTTKAESWTMLFFGSQPSHNVYMTANNSSDEYTTAASLYVFFKSAPSSESFDNWNFNTVKAFADSLRASGGNNLAEKNLIADIRTAQAAAVSLFPTLAHWDPHGSPTNTQIGNDLTAVDHAADAAKPTPCPSGQSSCTGAPAP